MLVSLEGFFDTTFGFDLALNLVFWLLDIIEASLMLFLEFVTRMTESSLMKGDDGFVPSTGLFLV